MTEKVGLDRHTLQDWSSESDLCLKAGVTIMMTS